MLFRRKKRRPKRPGFFKRIFRALFAIVILTGFVAFVSLATKEISSLDPVTFAKVSAPIFTRLGLSEAKTGQVAGELVERISQTGINKLDRDGSNSDISANVNLGPATLSGSTIRKSKTVVAKVAVMADSGDENLNLQDALQKAKELEVDYVFHLGDLTSWGDLKSLEAVRSVLEEGGSNWFALPGDHDLAQSASVQGGGGLENYTNVFGKNYAFITVNKVTFLLFDNSANKTPLDDARYNWFLNNVSYADYVLLSQPLYHSSPSDLMGVMGVFNGEEVKEINDQAKVLLAEVRNSDVQGVFAGDHHFSSISIDPVRDSLTHYVVGAIAEKRNVQVFPRFTILEVYSDNSYEVSEILF